jgi:hypothetical protein
VRLTDTAEAMSLFRIYINAGRDCMAAYRADPTSREGRMQLAQAWRHVESAQALLTPEAREFILDAPR